MKAKRIREISECVKSSAFDAWYVRYNELRKERTLLQEEREDALALAAVAAFKAESTLRCADETLFRAGECEDRSARAHAEFAEIENDSFETLSTFEMQRQKTSESWAELDRAEKRLEDHRQDTSDTRAELEAAKKGTTAEARLEAERLEQRLKDLEAEVSTLAAEVEEVERRLEEDKGQKDTIWHEVEDTWSASFRANMARTEYSFQARRTRTDAETLFARAAGERRQADELSEAARKMLEKLSDLEEELPKHMIRAEEQFECVLVDEFMYWPLHDSVRTAVCVPLIDEREHFNLQVTALQSYKVERARGLEFLEPVPDALEEDTDPRLHAFFAEGRPTLERRADPR